jgi:1-pyrroline-5-carboxylate dehydrogenase
VNIGPVVNRNAYKDYKDFCEEINQGGGRFLTGGNVKTGGMFDRGFYCEPAFVTDLPFEHRLWKHEMFLPITTIGRVSTLDKAMQIANDVNYGLTAGFYGSDDEVSWFFDNIQSGLSYANRPQGATTGAWPGFQPFGGWKASGSSGKNSGGLYYLPLYMHEQIHILVKPAPASKKVVKKEAPKKIVKKADSKKAVKKTVKKIRK